MYRHDVFAVKRGARFTCQWLEPNHYLCGHCLLETISLYSKRCKNCQADILIVTYRCSPAHEHNHTGMWWPECPKEKRK